MLPALEQSEWQRSILNPLVTCYSVIVLIVASNKDRRWAQQQMALSGWEYFIREGNLAGQELSFLATKNQHHNSNITG